MNVTIEQVRALLPSVQDRGAAYASHTRAGTVTVSKRDGSWTDNRNSQNVDGRDLTSLIMHLSSCDRAQAESVLAGLQGEPESAPDETVLVKASAIANLRAERQQLQADRAALQDQNAILQARLEDMAGEPVEPFVAAIPTILLVPFVVPAVVETKVLDMEVIEGLRAIMMDAFDALRGAHMAQNEDYAVKLTALREEKVDLAAMSDSAFEELLRAAMIEEVRRDNEARN